MGYYSIWKVWGWVRVSDLKSTMLTFRLPLWALLVKQLLLLKKKEKSASRALMKTISRK